MTQNTSTLWVNLYNIRAKSPFCIYNLFRIKVIMCQMALQKHEYLPKMNKKRINDESKGFHFRYHIKGW